MNMQRLLVKNMQSDSYETMMCMSNVVEELSALCRELITRLAMYEQTDEAERSIADVLEDKHYQAKS